MDESLENGFTLIETKGSRVGVINGLSDTEYQVNIHLEDLLE